MTLARHQARHAKQTARRSNLSAQAAAYNKQPNVEQMKKLAHTLATTGAVTVTENGFKVVMAIFRGQEMFSTVAVAESGKLTCDCFTFSDSGVCAHALAAEIFTEQNLAAAAEDNAPEFLEITSEAVCTAIERANRQSFAAFISAANNDRTKFEVFSAASGNTYAVEIRETIDGRVLGKCDCADFTNRNRVCKHQAIVWSSRKSVGFGLAA